MRALAACLGLAVAGCGRVGFDAAQDASSDGDASAKVGSRLDLDRHAPTEVLTDFPLLVVLDDERADRSRFGEEASTLRFRDADGAVIAHEIDENNAEGATLVWVRVPQYQGASTYITVEYGGTPAPRSPDPVWGNDFEAVWHLQDAGGVSDSSSRNRDGTATAGARAVPAQVGRGLSFDALAQEHVSISNGQWATTTELTMSAWVVVNGPSPSSVGYSAFVARQNAVEDDDFWLGLNNDNIYTAIFSTDSGMSTVNATPATFGEMHFVAATWRTNGVTVFLDGEIVDTGPTTGTSLLSTSNPILIGGSNNSGTLPRVADDDFLDGTIDEVRLERVARSSTWMQAANATARDAVITYGPIEPR